MDTRAPWQCIRAAVASVWVRGSTIYWNLIIITFFSLSVFGQECGLWRYGIAVCILLTWNFKTVKCQWDCGWLGCGLYIDITGTGTPATSAYLSHESKIFVKNIGLPLICRSEQYLTILHWLGFLLLLLHEAVWSHANWWPEDIVFNAYLFGKKISSNNCRQNNLLKTDLHILWNWIYLFPFYHNGNRLDHIQLIIQMSQKQLETPYAVCRCMRHFFSRSLTVNGPVYAWET